MIERLFFLIEKYPLNLVSHVSSLLPIVLGLWLFKHLTRNYKVALLLFALYFVADTCSLWLAIVGINTYPIQNSQPLFDISIVAAVYLNSFQRNSTKNWIKLIAALCLLVVLFSFRQDSIATVSLTTQRLFVTIITLLYFNKILTEATIKNILLHSLFWFSSGLLLYSAGTFFFSLFSSYLYSDVTSNDEFDPFWKLNQILYILLCLMSSVGAWVSKYDTDTLS